MRKRKLKLSKSSSPLCNSLSLSLSLPLSLFFTHTHTHTPYCTWMQLVQIEEDRGQPLIKLPFLLVSQNIPSVYADIHVPLTHCITPNSIFFPLFLRTECGRLFLLCNILIFVSIKFYI